MLTNNTKALILSEKIGKEAALSCLQEMYDYGTTPMKVLDMIKEKPNCKIMVGALNNSDTDGMLNILAKTNPAGLASGLSVLVKAEGALLILRNTDNEAELLASAKTAGVKLRVEKSEIVDVRSHKEHVVFNLETLAGVVDKIIGISPEIIISVNEAVPKEVKFGIKLSDLVDTAKVKSIMINHHFHGLDVLNNDITKQNSYGSGVINIIYENDCIVEKAKKELEDLREESCGKCTFCREGLYQLDVIFDDMTKGRSKKDDIAMVEELTSAMEFSCNCSLGKSSGEPAASAITEFKSEVEQHTKKKGCVTMVCAVGEGKAPAFMTHKCIKVDGGVMFESRFWMGCGLVEGKVVKLIPDGVAIPDIMPKMLFGHNIKEFANLAAILPKVYAEEKDNW